MTILCFLSYRERTKRRHLLSADSRVERLTWCDMLTRFVSHFCTFLLLYLCTSVLLLLGVFLGCLTLCNMLTRSPFKWQLWFEKVDVIKKWTKHFCCKATGRLKWQIWFPGAVYPDVLNIEYRQNSSVKIFHNPPYQVPALQFLS